MRFTGVTFLMIFICSCGNSGKAPKLKPYFFNRDVLDKMVAGRPQMHNISKRDDGTLAKEVYYLGDTVKYELQYDRSSRLQTVYKRNEHGVQVWQENYYSSGQRKAHYTLNGGDNPEYGLSVYNGEFEEYHEDGSLKAKGKFNKGQLEWQITFDKDGNAGDTLLYDYK
jgi:antitoxin component YwqK of YwqJK toxin-antitoxin module